MKLEIKSRWKTGKSIKYVEIQQHTLKQPPSQR